MEIKPSKRTVDLKSRLGDADEKVRLAAAAYRASACTDILAHFAAIGISPGDKVVIVTTGGWDRQVTRCDAVFMGAEWRSSRAEPMLKNVKVDGTASSVNARFSSYSSEVERAK